MNTLLTYEELQELTGTKMGRKQCAILKQNGIRFVTRSDGRPSLTWDAVNRVIAPTRPATHEMITTEPNMSAL